MTVSTSNLTGTAKPKFYTSPDGGSTYDLVPELDNIQRGGTQQETHETTNTDLADNFKTYLPGFSDRGGRK